MGVEMFSRTHGESKLYYIYSESESKSVTFSTSFVSAFLSITRFQSSNSLIAITPPSRQVRLFRLHVSAAKHVVRTVVSHRIHGTFVFLFAVPNAHGLSCTTTTKRLFWHPPFIQPQQRCRCLRSRNSTVSHRFSSSRRTKTPNICTHNFRR